MGIRTVRLDDETEKALAQVTKKTGWSLSTALKRGVLALPRNSQCLLRDFSPPNGCKLQHLGIDKKLARPIEIFVRPIPAINGKGSFDSPSYSQRTGQIHGPSNVAIRPHSGITISHIIRDLIEQ